MKNLFSILFILATFSACQNKPFTTYTEKGNKITRIDLNAPIDSALLKLTSLSKEFEIVQLETTDSCLVGQASYILGKNYIIAFSHSNILLFDRTGKYMRTLAVSGRGPGEFGYIVQKTITPSENRIFAIDMGKNFVHSWSIPEGEYFPVPLAEKGSAFALDAPTDTTLQIANLRNSKSEYKIYTQTLSGTFISGLLNTSTEDERKVELSNVLYNTGTAQYYHPHRTDSIYQILPDTLMLKYTLPLNTSQRLQVLQLTDQQLFISLYNITNSKSTEANIGGNKVSSVALEGYHVYYLIDIPAGQVSAFRRLQNDYFGIPAEFNNLTMQDNGTICLEYPASALVESLPEILENPELNAEVRKKAEQLKAELTEEDNPVLLIGTN